MPEYYENTVYTWVVGNQGRVSEIYQMDRYDKNFQYDVFGEIFVELQWKAIYVEVTQYKCIKLLKNKQKQYNKFFFDKLQSNIHIH